MGVDGQHPASATLPLGRRHGIHGTGGWVWTEVENHTSHWNVIPGHGKSLQVYQLCNPSPLRNTEPDCKQRIYFQWIPYCGPLMLQQHTCISPVLIPWSDSIAGRLLTFSKELKWWTPWCKPYIPFWWAGNPVKIAERLQQMISNWLVGRWSQQ